MVSLLYCNDGMDMGKLITQHKIIDKKEHYYKVSFRHGCSIVLKLLTKKVFLVMNNYCLIKTTSTSYYFTNRKRDNIPGDTASSDINIRKKYW